jgi:Lamin Tail Domain
MSLSACRSIFGVFMALTLALASMAIIPSTTVVAASCVRISGGQFDAPGNDNYAANLNGEYVRIKNYCSTRTSVSGWRLHDYGKIHTYTFATGFSIGPGVTVTVFSGRGTNTSTKRYWGRSYGAIWNNTPPERAYLRNTAGTLMSSWGT